MTWRQFVESEYNDGMFSMDSVYAQYSLYGSHYSYLKFSDGSKILILDTIIENYVYNVHTGGISGGAD